MVTDTLATGNTGRVYMPTAFTPNGDGLNDIIKPTFQNITSFSFTLYHASANLVFSSSTVGQGWAGTTTPANTAIKYLYRIQATTAQGKQIGVCGEVYQLDDCRPNTPVVYFEDQLTAFGFTGPTADVLPVCP